MWVEMHWPRTCWWPSSLNTPSVTEGEVKCFPDGVAAQSHAALFSDHNSLSFVRIANKPWQSLPLTVCCRHSLLYTSPHILLVYRQWTNIFQIWIHMVLWSCQQEGKGEEHREGLWMKWRWTCRAMVSQKQIQGIGHSSLRITLLV